jgi:hypothetical protein
MTALRLRLQKEIFDPTDEQLVGLARVIKYVPYEVAVPNK